MDVGLKKRGTVWLVPLDPTVGSELQKTRPCLVVSPDEANVKLNTVIVAPITSTIKKYPSRYVVRVAGKKGSVALDQIRAVDRTRLVKYLDVLSTKDLAAILSILGEMFAL